MGASLHQKTRMSSSLSMSRLLLPYSAGLRKSSARVQRKARLAPFCRVQSGLRSTYGVQTTAELSQRSSADFTPQ